MVLDTILYVHTNPRRELLSRILFSVLVVVIYRLGASIPVAGLDKENAGLSVNSVGLGVLDLLSGGALSNLAIFALGVIPFVTAGIVMQLMGVLVPSLKQGPGGEPGAARKVSQYTRYLAFVLAAVQAVGLYWSLRAGNGIVDTSVDLVAGTEWWRMVLIVFQFLIGFMMAMYLAEFGTRKGLGNGSSLIILSGILASAPRSWYSVVSSFEAAGVFLIVLSVISLSVLVWLDLTKRNVPVLFMRSITAKESFLPLKLAKNGMMPAIFASTMIALPVSLAGYLPETGFGGEVQSFIIRNLSGPTYLYAILSGVLIIAFSYLYNAIQFNTEDLAVDLSRQQAFIPGVRPGPETAKHIQGIINRLTLLGSLILVMVAFIPLVVSANLGAAELPLSGVALLIAVSSAQELMRQGGSLLAISSYKKALPALNTRKEEASSAVNSK